MKKPTLRQQVAELREERDLLRANLEQLVSTLARVAGPSGSAMLSVIHSRCTPGKQGPVLSLVCRALLLERDPDGMPSLTPQPGLDADVHVEVNQQLLIHTKDAAGFMRHTADQLGERLGKHFARTLIHARG